MSEHSLVQPKVTFIFSSKLDTKTASSAIVFCVAAGGKSLTRKNFGIIPANILRDVLKYSQRIQFEPKENSSFTFDDKSGKRISIVCLKENCRKFELLTACRKALDPIWKSKAKSIAVSSCFKDEFNLALIDAFVSSATVALYEFPKYTSKPSTKSKSIQFHFAFTPKNAKEIAAQSYSMAQSTNLVRFLGKRAGNDLDTKTYRAYLKQFAKSLNLKHQEWNFDALKKMGAGAFVAVAQGSNHRDAAVVKLEYRSRNKNAKHLCLVGKGIVFDTGGSNLKPAQYMMGMNGDMSGSAVAIALMQHLVQMRSDLHVTTFVGITDNSIGPDAYRQNDVIRSLKGTTIEIIHTDAEGRMILSDILHMATKEKPDLMMDFATLTGACVGAIGTTYSGVFTNRENLHSKLIAAGSSSGERVWPFPLDKDFADCLDSDVADIKQCRLKGGVDHIEAAMFLKHFVGEEIPWVHVDLSAIGHEGGLAHIPTEETGFGIRFSNQFVQDFFKIETADAVE